MTDWSKLIMTVWVRLSLPKYFFIEYPQCKYFCRLCSHCSSCYDCTVLAVSIAPSSPAITACVDRPPAVWQGFEVLGVIVTWPPTAVCASVSDRQLQERDGDVAALQQAGVPAGWDRTDDQTASAEPQWQQVKRHTHTHTHRRDVFHSPRTCVYPLGWRISRSPSPSWRTWQLSGYPTIRYPHALLHRFFLTSAGDWFHKLTALWNVVEREFIWK